MAIWKKPWFSTVVVVVLCIALMAGCAPQQRPDDGSTPSPTRNPGVNDMGPNDNRNNFGWNDNRNNNIGNNMADRTPGNNGARTVGNMRLADDIADRLTNMREIDTATVMLTDNNAYVAVDLPGNKEGRVTDDLKDRVSDEVRRMDRSVDNVYVSADADFFNRMGGYARDIRNGRPIQGLADEVTETIRRVFPTAH